MIEMKDLLDIYCFFENGSVSPDDAFSGSTNEHSTSADVGTETDISTENGVILET